jgi:hypothetical protein
MAKRREKMPVVEADITVWDPDTSPHPSVLTRDADYTHADKWGTIITDAGQVDVQRGWAIIDYGANRFAAMPAEDVDSFFEPVVSESVAPKALPKKSSAKTAVDE